MRIRSATELDAAAVAALWTEAYTGRGSEGRSRPYGPADFPEASSAGEVFVAEQDGETVGVVVLYPPNTSGRVIGEDGEAELSRLAVATGARRAGIGRALAELCSACARDLGASGVALWSRPHQVQAHRLYESRGYRRAPERDSVDGEGRRWVFVLRLDQHS